MLQGIEGGGRACKRHDLHGKQLMSLLEPVMQYQVVTIYFEMILKCKIAQRAKCLVKTSVDVKHWARCLIKRLLNDKSFIKI